MCSPVFSEPVISEKNSTPGMKLSVNSSGRYVFLFVICEISHFTTFLNHENERIYGLVYC